VSLRSITGFLERFSRAGSVRRQRPERIIILVVRRIREELTRTPMAKGR
jgi:hypothetical protein